MKKSLTLIGSLLIASTTNAVVLNNNQYQWSFLSQLDWPQGYNQNTGKPDNLTWNKDNYSSDFFNRISNALPERVINESFLTSDSGSNIHLSERAEVFISFIHEGAGYKNAFGYFTYDKENPPTSIDQIQETIVFPNLSYPHLTSGHRLSIGTFDAGTSIGFFIAANGFSYYSGVKTSKSNFFYSLKNLNPEQDENLKQHNVLIYDQETKEVVIGFEDLPRTWGDNDFNDAVFSVKSTPETAIDSSNIVKMPNVNDSDADGVADAEDQFPDDFKRAFSAYYPSKNDWVTLAFEDNWPQVGDYDMNDLVVRENLQTIYNSEGQISGFKVNGYIDARGANFRNGFALRLLDKQAGLIASSTLSINGEVFTKQEEADQTSPVIVLWQDSHIFTQTNGEGKCVHFNTIKECPNLPAVPFTLDVSFNLPVDSLSHSSLDFFIFRTNNRSREIHFAGYPPTDLFDVTQFNKFDDTSNPEDKRYFKTKDNLPWALKIHSQWRYPREYIDVVWAYPDYEFWVESSGEESNNWYKTSERNTHYY